MGLSLELEGDLYRLAGFLSDFLSGELTEGDLYLFLDSSVGLSGDEEGERYRSFIGLVGGSGLM
jgi:hypothetical protein